MIVRKTLENLYKDFYEWLGKPEMFKLMKGGKYECSDVFPLIYLKMALEGAATFRHIKHVVIDEMQDYTPIQYEVIASLYPCKKTVLGEYNQSVNPLSSSSAESIQQILPESECVYMHKSYRSTLQTTELAQSIHCNPNLIPIERHGEKPILSSCGSDEQEVSYIHESIRAFRKSDFNSFGIICKTQAQADSLYRSLRKERDAVRLLDANSKVFSNGVVIATARLAKGLEFDQVLVPFCNDSEYHAQIDRHMLYVACTGAMHRLTVTHVGDLSPFLKSALDLAIVVDQRACA